MAATQAAETLTEAHRLAQSTLGARTVQAMFDVWPLLDPENLDGTVAAWLRATLRIMAAARAESATLASSYLTTFRALELGDVGGFVPIVADTLDTVAATTSMLVTGPYRLKAAPALQLEQALGSAQVATARSAMRHATNGGRDTILGTVRADRKAHGWARVASGNPCAFCRMLTSRGPVYHSQESASFACHDGCHCVPEPVYHADAAWPPGAREYRAQWDEVTKGLSGTDALNAFRRSLQ